MTVKAVKLISGEEIIGEVHHEEFAEGTTNVTEITLKNPVVITMSRTATGDLNIGFLPFAPYLGKNLTFDFPIEKLLFVKEVDDQMRNQYNSIFSGIVTPPKNLIVE